MEGIEEKWCWRRLKETCPGDSKVLLCRLRIMVHIGDDAFSSGEII